MFVCIMKTLIFITQNHDQCGCVIFFSKYVKCQGQRKDLITGNIHVKFQSSGTHCSKLSISKVKVVKKQVKLQGQGHRVKTVGTHGSLGLVTRNICVKQQSSSIHYRIQKLLARLKFQIEVTELWNDRQDKNNMPPNLRSWGQKNVKILVKI